MSDNIAVIEGYTREVVADGGMITLYLLVKPDTDFDDQFKTWDTDGCSRSPIVRQSFNFEGTMKRRICLGLPPRWCFVCTAEAGMMVIQIGWLIAEIDYST